MIMGNNTLKELQNVGMDIYGINIDNNRLSPLWYSTDVFRIGVPQFERDGITYPCTTVLVETIGVVNGTLRLNGFHYEYGYGVRFDDIDPSIKTDDDIERLIESGELIFTDVNKFDVSVIYPVNDDDYPMASWVSGDNDDNKYCLHKFLTPDMIFDAVIRGYQLLNLGKDK